MTALTVETLDQTDTYIFKFGTAVLDQADEVWFDTLAKNVAALTHAGKKVLIVTSGAVGRGRRRLGLPEGKLSEADQQAAFTAGQHKLMQIYDAAFEKEKLVCGQALLTNEDADAETTSKNAITGIQKFIELGGIPICNENDLLRTEELTKGDNDGLAFHTAKMLSETEFFGKVAIVIFSMVPGFCKEDPHINPHTEIFETISEVTVEHRKCAGQTSNGGRGGPNSKLNTGELCINAGIPLILTSGEEPGCIKEIFANVAKPSTLFIAPVHENSAESHNIALRI